MQVTLFPFYKIKDLWKIYYEHFEIQMSCILLKIQLRVHKNIASCLNPNLELLQMLGTEGYE